jgi:hypothetical protein
MCTVFSHTNAVSTTIKGTIARDLNDRHLFHQGIDDNADICHVKKLLLLVRTGIRGLQSVEINLKITAMSRYLDKGMYCYCICK